jgi:diguanylate cyclase
MSLFPPRPPHWAVRMNYRIRALSWLAVLAVLVLEWRGAAWPLSVWALLLVQFGLYPQLAYVLARRSAKPLATELRTLGLDALCLGFWAAWLGAPLWLSYAMCTGSAMNLAAFKGRRGLGQALLLQACGAVLAVLLHGFRFQPDMGPVATVMCMVALSTYLLAFAQSSSNRTRRLHAIRLRLVESERAVQQQLTENQALQVRLKEQANHDALTGLFNRRFLDATLGRELIRCQREGLTLALIMVDLDHFKRVNDSAGHLVGDEVLRRVASLLNHDSRGSDVVCRYGGEEFLLMLPNMRLNTALERAEHYRESLASSSLLIEGQRLRVTLSAGVACYPEHGQLPGELLAAADRALYQAKSRGRNRVEVAQLIPLDEPAVPAVAA